MQKDPATVTQQKPDTTTALSSDAAEPLTDCLGNPIREGAAYAEHLQKKFEAGLDVFKTVTQASGYRTIGPITSPKTMHYRCSAKFAVRAYEESNLGYRMGLFKPGTHEVVHATTCPTQTRAINRLLRDMYPLIAGFDIQPYDETTHTGNLRYIAVRCGQNTDELMLTLVMKEPNQPLARALVQKLRALHHKIKAAFINVNSGQGNAIFSEEFIKISGTESLRESLNGLIFEMGPSAFFQVNPWQASKIYQRIEDLAGRATGRSHAWDLYSGVGQIAVHLCRLGYNVLALEEIPEALENSAKNAKLNGYEDSFSGLCGRVEDLKAQLAMAPLPDVITVNPSRRGLAPEVAELLADIFHKKHKTKLIYISCEMDTLARDTKRLLDSTLKIRQVEGYDMFPHTEKMEWISVFTA